MTQEELERRGGVEGGSRGMAKDWKKDSGEVLAFSDLVQKEKKSLENK